MKDDDSAVAHVPLCLACSACCHSFAHKYVHVTGSDYARLAAAELEIGETEALVTWDEHRAYMRMVEGHCVALQAIDDRFVCTVYEYRPTLCRELERGGPACEADRLIKLRTPSTPSQQ
jgi:uncharacterized protein